MDDRKPLDMTHAECADLVVALRARVAELEVVVFVAKEQDALNCKTISDLRARLAKITEVAKKIGPAPVFRDDGMTLVSAKLLDELAAALEGE